MGIEFNSRTGAYEGINFFPEFNPPGWLVVLVYLFVAVALAGGIVQLIRGLA